ncbi:MAG: hypothetical protein GX567_04950 [Clostridia bacterium]|nr:hypothetical protein [Clostridia bacterium]
MKNKQLVAKIIRTITVPPVMVLTMLIILWFQNNELFSRISDAVVAVCGLAIVPVLAYPLQKYIKSYKDMGREGQRKLAFLFSVIGYGLSLIYGLIAGVHSELLFIFFTYFLSVIFLVISNKLLHIKASGHACSITGPLVFLSYFLGVNAILPCLVIFSLICWSSLALKRHSKQELFFGALVCIIAFLLTLVGFLFFFY